MSTSLFDPLPPAIEALFENRRKRRKPATLHDSAHQVLSKGIVLLGVEGDLSEVFYPKDPPVLSDDSAALASWIQTEDETLHISNLKHCWCGSEIHCHFSRVL